MKNKDAFIFYLVKLKNYMFELKKRNSTASQAVVCARTNAVDSIRIRLGEMQQEFVYLEENEDVDGIELFEDKINSILSVFDDEYGNSDFDKEYAKEIERISQKLRDMISEPQDGAFVINYQKVTPDLFHCNGQDLRITLLDGHIYQQDAVYVTTDYELDDMAYACFNLPGGGAFISIYEKEIENVEILTKKQTSWVNATLLKQTGLDRIYKHFGEEYLKEKHSYYLHGFCDTDVYQVFVPIKGWWEFPGKTFEDAKISGWVVYGLVLLNGNNGEILTEEYGEEIV